MSSEKPVLHNLFQCFPCPTASHDPFYPPITPLVLLLTDENYGAYCKGNKPSDILLQMSGPQSLFLLTQEIFSLLTDLLCFICLTPLKRLLPKTFLSDTCSHTSVTDVGPEDPIFLGIVWLFERDHLQGMSNASDINKPNYQKPNLQKSKLNKHSSAFWGKPSTVHFAIVMIQLGELEGNLFTG